MANPRLYLLLVEPLKPGGSPCRLVLEARVADEHMSDELRGHLPALRVALVPARGAGPGPGAGERAEPAAAGREDAVEVDMGRRRCIAIEAGRARFAPLGPALARDATAGGPRCGGRGGMRRQPER